MAVVDQGNGNGDVIDTYKATGRNLGNPIYTTPLANGLVTFAFTPGSKLLLAADPASSGVGLYEYPAGGPAVKSATLPNGALPIGVAIVPTEQFTLR